MRTESALDLIFALPTWLLYRAVRSSLPVGHKLKAPLSFVAWTHSATDLTLFLGLVFWVFGGSFVALGLALVLP